MLFTNPPGPLYSGPFPFLKGDKWIKMDRLLLAFHYMYRLMPRLVR